MVFGRTKRAPLATQRAMHPQQNQQVPQPGIPMYTGTYTSAAPPMNGAANGVHAGVKPTANVPETFSDDVMRVEKKQQRRNGREWLPYKGNPGLVIAIDLGTTYSGASYCILTPGQRPKIEDVKRFPGQATAGSKVPSVILYSSSGHPCLFGAEAVEGASAYKVMLDGGAAARWWKLYLKPSHLELIVDPDSSPPDLDPLPFGVQAEAVVAQFLGYMAKCVGSYITQSHSNGSDTLRSLAANTRYIITVPNGWELHQQQVLRKACIEAGLVAPENADSISFVSEAEASINFCAQSPTASEWLSQEGKQLIVCDAGGGTIDISTYEVVSTQPVLQIAETAASDCLIAGSTTVDRRARDLIAERLRGTELDNEKDLEHFQLIFCSSIKETFSDKTHDQYLAVGPYSLNREEVGIKMGKLVFTGEEIAQLFEPSIRATEKSIRSRIKPNAREPVVVAMVGGFSESVFMRKELQDRLGNAARLCKPDEATAKAVASGAVAWLIDGVVSARVAKLTYGIRCSTIFKSHLPEHAVRAAKCFAGNDGQIRLPNAFGSVLHKGESGGEDDEQTEKFFMTWPVHGQLTKDVNLYVYRGEEEKEPFFLDEGGYEQLCRFQVDMEPFRQMLSPRTGASGQQFYSVPVKLAMRLNGTEIQAQVLFEHAGQTYRSPATIFTDVHADE